MAEQRSQLFIKRQFQQSMILEVILITFILINVIVIAGYLVIDSISDIQQIKAILAYTVAALEIVGFFVVYRYNLKASHRIAGPIFTLERCIAAFAAGDLTVNMRLRKNDQFQEICESMNRAIGALRERVENVQMLTAELQKQTGTENDVMNNLLDELNYFKTKLALSKEGGHEREVGRDNE